MFGIPMGGFESFESESFCSIVHNSLMLFIFFMIDDRWMDGSADRQIDGSMVVLER